MGKKRKMTNSESPRADNETCINNKALSLDELSCGSLILENILSFLDTPTLKAVRLLSRKWDEAALPLLSKRTHLNILKFYESLYRTQERLIPRAELYSSWKLTVENGKNQFPSIYGANVRSLYIVDISLSRACLAWIRELLSEWCPRVTKIHFHFQGLPLDYDPQTLSHLQEWRESYAYGKSLKNEDFLKKFQAMLELKKNKNHTFRPFPQLPNLQTISLGVGCGREDSLFAFNVISSCPNLKHLFLKGLNPRREDVKESGFRILEYLSRRPDITTKLETFVWEVNMGHIPKERPSLFRRIREDEQVRKLYPEEQRQPVRLLTDTKRAIPPMQFSDKLKYLHWDVLWVEQDGTLGSLGLLRGTLDKTVAGNLRRLCTRKAVMDPTSFPDLNEEGILAQRVKCLRMDYLLMPKLVELELGLRSCYTISISDLLAAAHNLRKLTISGCECHDVLKDSVELRRPDNAGRDDDLPSDDIWDGSDFLPLRPHTNLKFLDAGVSMRNNKILQKTVQKFPNLEELWIGPRFDMNHCKTKLALGSVFKILHNLRSLKRLKWNYEGKVNLNDLIENLSSAGKLTTTLERYELKLSSSLRLVEHVGLEGYCRRKEELLDCLHNWPKQSKCGISVSWDNPELFGWADGKCSHYSRKRRAQDCYGIIQSFFRFVREEGLPIHFRVPDPPPPAQPIRLSDLCGGRVPPPYHRLPRRGRR
jgi:hypothetical protein